MKRTKSVLTLATAAVIGSFVFSGVAQAMPEEMPKDMNFTITKGGTPIGTHVFKFSGNINKLKVNVETHTKVKVLFLNFVYDHKRTERWSGANLVALQSKTDDDGTPHKLNIRASSTKISGIADGKPISKATMALPVTFWNSDVLLNKNLFSALDGGTFKLKWKKLPDETIKVEGKMVKANVYEMTGDLERKLWYSKKGEFLKTTFKKKGYDIAWIRE